MEDEYESTLQRSKTFSEHKEVFFVEKYSITNVISLIIVIALVPGGGGGGGRRKVHVVGLKGNSPP